MASNEDKPIPELYMVCAHALEEFAPLKGKGVVSKDFSNNVIIAVTADQPETFIPEGCMGAKLKPFHFYIWMSGWLTAIIGPGEGIVIGGQEDNLIKIIGGNSEGMDRGERIKRS